MTDEPQKPPLQNIEYLHSEWRATVAALRDERRKDPRSRNLPYIAKLEQQKQMIERHIRVLNGADPDDDTEPPF